MRRKLFIIVLLCSFSCGIFAQQNDEKRKNDFEKFKVKRVEYISSSMNLNEEESKAFWPICNELQDKKIQLNKELRQEIKNIKEKEKTGEKLTEADYEKIVKLSADVKEKEADLDKSYIPQFKKVISYEQIFKYQRAEMRFARTMLNRDGGDHKKR